MFLLTVIPFFFALVSAIHANHDLRHRMTHRRRQSIATVLPGNWTSYGCYSDNTGSRTLAAASYVDTVNMTVESCISYCNAELYVYAGVEYYQECYCGNAIANGATQTNLASCNFPCRGNASESCGGSGLLNIYWSGVPPPPPPIIVPSVGLWESLGCWNDSTANRVIPVGIALNTSTFSIETCTSACYNAGYVYAGAEYASQCFCGLAIGSGGAVQPDSDCNMLCSGNSSEYCGGPSRLNLYNYTGTPPPPPTTPPSGGTTVYSVTSALPGNWSYEGCWVDQAYGRVFTTMLADNQNVTVESCIASCSALNQTLAGLEYSVQCMCGDYMVNGAVEASDPSTCNMGCGGNNTEACGGPNRISLYSSNGNITALPVPVTLNTSLPGSWQYVGCLAEPGAARVFPYQIINTYNNTVQDCLSQCSAFGYPAGGMEYSDECWCGDISDISLNNGIMAPETDCNMLCSGDPHHLCGGQERLQLYEWAGNISVYSYPTNTGRYEYLIGSLIVPLVATVGINNKVTFVEKYGTSVYPNSTGAYELDLTLVDDYTQAWRAMHVKTDVFCSASIILPDKGGRQINIGGWSLDSLYGVRLYTPDGSAGVNGTNDWEENVNEVSLQRGRWYPTALLLANGSILVVGGENGSNGPPEPTLEIIPTPAGGPTFMFLDFLNRTDPNNLYPFLYVLPSGNILISYYNEARILDQTSLQTIQVLPNTPGNVVSFLAGRTYPMEGVSVLFPQYAPYTDPVRVMICGGSNFGDALDNCISIQPEVANPVWTLERMPSKRVMPCMATLPDGTFLIVNGAQQGVAGFGLASDPNLQALLYDPSQPVNQRISVLNSTIVARLYHSEATLLTDGRVLISGSDPQTYLPDGTPIYPEEFRIEVYLPPYLTDGTIQPQFNITTTDWSYNGQYVISVTLYQGTTSGMRISLIYASSSTHGNNMGSRILFPAFTCTGNTCTITAPPNAYVSPPGWYQLFVLDGPTPSHSQWVRIGGDPAELGLWPQFPDFTPPGM